jgi:hypothetical protein
MTLTALRHRRTPRSAVPSPPPAADGTASAEPAERVAAPAPPAQTIRAVEHSQRIIKASTNGHAIGTSAEPLITTGVPVVRYQMPSSPSLATSEYPVIDPGAFRRAMAVSSVALGPPMGRAEWFGVPPRRRAPLGLRLGVLLLVPIAAASVEIARVKPAWLPKHVLGSVAPDAKAKLATRPGVTTMTLRSSSPTQTVYALPTSSYAIGVSIDHPCWVLIKAVPAGTTVFAQTLLPGAALAPIPVSGSMSITIAARANAIVITNGAHVLGTIPAPVVGRTYVLEGAASSSSAH